MYGWDIEPLVTFSWIDPTDEKYTTAIASSEENY
jgi:hypothetical protein